MSSTSRPAKPRSLNVTPPSTDKCNPPPPGPVNWVLLAATNTRAVLDGSTATLAALMVVGRFVAISAQVLPASALVKSRAEVFGSELNGHWIVAYRRFTSLRPMPRMKSTPCRPPMVAPAVAAIGGFEDSLGERRRIQRAPVIGLRQKRGLTQLCALDELPRPARQARGEMHARGVRIDRRAEHIRRDQVRCPRRHGPALRGNPGGSGVGRQLGATLIHHEEVGSADADAAHDL